MGQTARVMLVMPTNTRVTTAQGVAIIEVLIAGVVLAIAVVGLALLFMSGQTFVVAEGDERVAIYLAQQKIERLRAGGYTSLQVGDSTLTTGCPAEPCYDEDPVSGFARYRRMTVVQCVDPNSFAVVSCPAPITAKRIAVTIISATDVATGRPKVAKAETVTIESALTLH